MPGWVGVVGTFAVSLILAYGFLRLRCRAVGPPFGPRARFWACLIVVGTAVVSTAVGLVIVAASDHVHAAFVGIVVPGGLWFTSLPPRGDQLSSGRTFAAGLLTRPFSRLYERMGDDMQDWCDTRLRAAAPEPQWIADAATYYYAQVRAGIKYSQAHADLGRWQESITHKIAIVRLISLDTTPARRRPTPAGPPDGKRCTERTEPVSRLRLPARVPELADLSVPAVRSPAPAPPSRADGAGQ
jgi:hypothetical protein